MNIRKIILEEIEDFDWVKGISDKITYGTCIKSEKGVDYIVQDLSHKTETLFVKSKRGGVRQTWSLRSVNNKLNNGTLKLCNISEQEDFDWIKDIKITPLTVAEDIIDQTEIMPDAFMGTPMISVPFTNLQYSEPNMFISVVQHFDDYITKHYGEKDISFRNSVWNMWSHEINNRLRQLNESTSFGWIDNIPKYPAGVIIDTAASKMSEEEIMSLLDKWGFKWEGGHNIFDEDGVPYIENPYRWILVGPMEYTHKKNTSNIQTICNNCIMHDYVHPHKGNYDFTKYHIITL